MSDNLREIVQDHYYSNIEEISADGSGSCLDSLGCSAVSITNEPRTSRGGHHGAFTLEVRATVCPSAPALIRRDAQHGGRLARSAP